MSLKSTLILLFFLTHPFLSKIFRLKFYKEKLSLADSDPDNFIINKMSVSHIYTEIEVGTPGQKITMQMSMNDYCYFIVDKNCVKQNTALSYFDPSKSTTFFSSQIKRAIILQPFQEMMEVKDVLELECGEIDIEFPLVTKINKEVSGFIGLKLYDKYDLEFGKYNFIELLKNNSLISDSSFVFHYITDNEGELIIGEMPDVYNSSLSKNAFKSVYVSPIEDSISWRMNFDDVYIDGENSLGSYGGFFDINYPLIKGVGKYREHLLSRFFQQRINSKDCFEVESVFYFHYYCKRNVDISDVGNLILLNKELNASFILRPKDLFYLPENSDFIFFYVTFDNGAENYGEFWRIGEPFLRKYELVFNHNSKRIGIYDTLLKNLSSGSNFSNTITIIILLLIIVGLLFFVGFLYKTHILKKKMKANELEDSFYYQTKEDKMLMTGSIN